MSRASGRSVLTPPYSMRLTAHSACLRSSYARRKNRNVLCVVFSASYRSCSGCMISIILQDIDNLLRKCPALSHPTPPSHGVYLKEKEHFCFACPLWLPIFDCQLSSPFLHNNLLFCFPSKLTHELNGKRN